MYHCTSFLAALFFVNSFFHCTDKRPSDTYLMINVIHVLVITRARVPYGKYWHSIPDEQCILSPELIAWMNDDDDD